MARNMSFSLTTEQIRNRTKTMTRRLGWVGLKKGEILNACVKCQGLRTGEKIQRLAIIEVVQVWREMLCAIAPGDVFREGFDMTRKDFIAMFCQHMRCEPETVVTCILFRYLDDTKGIPQ
jgi:hypothetical protein